MVAVLCVSIAATADHLDRQIVAALQQEHVPGLSFAVVRHGRIVREGGYGIANLEWNTAVTPDTKFEIASISKMFAGAAARILIEEGRLDPEAAVGRYLPSVPDSWGTMKVRHLLTMSSGLPEDFGGDSIPYNEDVIGPVDEPSMLRAFYGLSLRAPIGRRFIYSGPNYAMIGMIVAGIAGMPYQQFVHERLFMPAGMSDSSFIDNSGIVVRRATGYRRTRAGELRQGWYLGQYLHSRPDVGVLTTARDLGKWLIALEQRKIVRAPEAIWEATVSDAGLPLDYSYGWISTTWLGHRRQEHSGGYRTGFHTFVARYPDDDVAVVVLTNCDFSAVRDYVALITRAFIPHLADPAAEARKPDGDPAETRRLIAAMQAVREGRVDETAMHADAVEPVGIEEIRGFLQAAGPFAYAGRGTLNGRPLRMHGHDLVAYETLTTVIDKRSIYLTIYIDPSGRISYLELTN